MLCPVCENISTNTHKCTNCGWEFINFTEEPTPKEQNEYTQLLHNYRTEFFFALAVQYHDNKQYTEVIECCRISCEHQLFENPLALMASSYLELGNKEEALKFANMALSINPQNELSISIRGKLNKKEYNINTVQQLESISYEDKILKLTPEILTKGQFEKTVEYEERINNLRDVEIGRVTLIEYDADSEELNFKLPNSLNYLKLNNLKLDNISYKIKLSSVDAKSLYSKDYVPLIAKIGIKNSKISINDIKIGRYSFFTAYREKIEYDKRYEARIKDLSTIWYDENNSREWQIKISTTTYTSKEVINSEGREWKIPSPAIMESLFNSLRKNKTPLAKDILEYLLTEDFSVWLQSDKGRECYYKPSVGTVYGSTSGSGYAYCYQIRKYRVKHKEVKKEVKKQSFFEKIWN